MTSEARPRRGSCVFQEPRAHPMRNVKTGLDSLRGTSALASNPRCARPWLHERRHPRLQPAPAQPRDPLRPRVEGSRRGFVIRVPSRRARAQTRGGYRYRECPADALASRPRGARVPAARRVPLPPRRVRGGDEPRGRHRRRPVRSLVLRRHRPRLRPRPRGTTRHGPPGDRDATRPSARARARRLPPIDVLHAAHLHGPRLRLGRSRRGAPRRAPARAQPHARRLPGSPPGRLRAGALHPLQVQTPRRPTRRRLLPDSRRGDAERTRDRRGRVDGDARAIRVHRHRLHARPRAVVLLLFVF